MLTAVILVLALSDLVASVLGNIGRHFDGAARFLAPGLVHDVLEPAAQCPHDLASIRQHLEGLEGDVHLALCSGVRVGMNLMAVVELRMVGVLPDDVDVLGVSRQRVLEVAGAMIATVLQVGHVEVGLVQDNHKRRQKNEQERPRHGVWYGMASRLVGTGRYGGQVSCSHEAGSGVSAGRRVCS